MDNYPTTGPIGSTDRRCPINDKSLYDELHADDSTQRDSWREDSIKDWVMTLGLPCGDAKFPLYVRIRPYLSYWNYNSMSHKGRVDMSQVSSSIY